MADLLTLPLEPPNKLPDSAPVQVLSAYSTMMDMLKEARKIWEGRFASRAPKRIFLQGNFFKVNHVIIVFVINQDSSLFRRRSKAIQILSVDV